MADENLAVPDALSWALKEDGCGVRDGDLICFMIKKHSNLSSKSLNVGQHP